MKKTLSKPHQKKSEKKFNTDAKNAESRYRQSHECSQIDCRAYESTDSDSDVEERVRLKATKFFKAYPKDISVRKKYSSFHQFGSNQQKTHLASTKINTEPLMNGETLPFSNSINEEEITLNNKYRQYRIVKSNDSNSTPMSLKLVSNYYEGYSDHSTRSRTSKRLQKDYIELSSSSDSEGSSPESVTPLDLTWKSQNRCAKASTDEKSTTGTNIKETGYSGANACTPLTSEPTSDEASSKTRCTRPFKSYPVDPLTVTIGFDTARMSVSGGHPENYAEFRKRILGNSIDEPDINANMRRFHNFENDDDSYREKRKRNNMAAKRSRDTRRAKEDELAVRCAYLEQENMFLKRKMAEMEGEGTTWRVQ